jgi:hypothetical protein
LCIPGYLQSESASLLLLRLLRLLLLLQLLY